MSKEVVVLPAEAPRRHELEADGWVVTARSWGAGLDADRITRKHLDALVERAAPTTVRALGPDDVRAALGLDAATVGDYPGSVATQHQPLTRDRATPSPTRRAFGAFLADGTLTAMTFIDINADRSQAETDFTVVGRPWRGKSLGTAVKAASVLALLDQGVTRFRTGGSADNTAIQGANHALGYIIDEQWVTMTGPFH